MRQPGRAVADPVAIGKEIKIEGSWRIFAGPPPTERSFDPVERRHQLVRRRRGAQGDGGVDKRRVSRIRPGKRRVKTRRPGEAEFLVQHEAGEADHALRRSAAERKA